MSMKLVLIFILILFKSQNIFAQVMYTDFKPNKICYTPSEEGTDSVFIDVNRDGQDDFLMLCYKFFNYVHQNCCWQTTNRIIGLNPLNEIAVDTTYGPPSPTCKRIFLDSGFCVGSNYSYQNSATFYTDAQYYFCGPPSNQPKYFPFQLHINNNLHYGWFRILATYTSIILYDVALNITPDSCINTGRSAIDTSEIQKSNYLNIFANPNSGTCNITIPDELLNEQNLVLTIYDVSGKIIQQQQVKIEQEKIKVNIEAEAKGIYNVTLGNAKKIYSGKIVFE